MKDRYDRDVNVNQEVVIYYGGEFYNATITSMEDERVYFKIINPQVGEPKTGSFNRIETGRYLTIKTHKEKPSTNDTQPHYDNTHGSLYKIAEQRGWNSYQFDIIKRIDRALKKGQFDEDLKKTKYLIDLWSKEVNND